MRSAFRLWLTDMREYILLSSLLAKGSERIRRMRLLTKFRLWINNAKENRRQRLILIRAASRIRYRSINKCIGSWQDLVIRRHQGRLQFKKMFSILLRYRKRVTIIRWRKWLQFARQAEARQSNYTAQLSRAMARWKNRNKAAAFRTWVDRISEIQKNRRLVARAAARWLMRSLQNACQHGWNMLIEKSEIGRWCKVAAKWLKRLESRSFASWVTL